MLVRTHSVACPVSCNLWGRASLLPMLLCSRKVYEGQDRASYPVRSFTHTQHMLSTDCVHRPRPDRVDARHDFHLKSADFHLWHVLLRNDSELVTWRETQRKN